MPSKEAWTCLIDIMKDSKMPKKDIKRAKQYYNEERINDMNIEKFIFILNYTAMWIWQLPQHLLGLFLLWIFKAKYKMHYGDSVVYSSTTMPGGISLGKIIIVWPKARTRVIKHEYGHSIQSKILGPLYLLIIGLPSIIQAMLSGTLLKHENYYKRWPENWADKLGNVTEEDVKSGK